MPNEPLFRKDMPPGALGRIESGDLREGDGFVRVRMHYMHDGQPVQLVDFINPEHIAVQGTPEDTTSAVNEADVPEPVRVAFAQQSAMDSRLTLEIVNDWESLITDNGAAASMHFLKARGTLALELVMKVLPTYDSTKLLVLHTVNHVGARRTEVWTLEDFAPGTLIFAPFSSESKDRMYTHLAASHMVLPKKVVPGNKVLALDGRNQGHLSHMHPSQHRAYATGSLFWCITRSQAKNQANLVQQVCEVSMPKVTVNVPGRPLSHTKLAAADVPQVNVLTNLALVKKHTRLVAMDDLVVAKAREAEKTLEAQKRKADADKRHQDQIPANKPRTG